MNVAGAAALTATLFLAAVWDMRTRTIPNRLVAFGAAMAVAVDLVYLGPGVTLARLAAAVAVLGAWLLLPTGMGAGDAKLLAVCALLGGPIVALGVLFGASVCMSVFALARLAWTRGRTRPGALPMAPFMAAVWAVALMLFMWAGGP